MVDISALTIFWPFSDLPILKCNTCLPPPLPSHRPFLIVYLLSIHSGCPKGEPLAIIGLELFHTSALRVVHRTASKHQR